MFFSHKAKQYRSAHQSVVFGVNGQLTVQMQRAGQLKGELVDFALSERFSGALRELVWGDLSRRDRR